MVLGKGRWAGPALFVVLLPAASLLIAKQTSVVEAATQKPTNLKVLPKETSMQDVQRQMSAIKRDLGVECSFCHEQNPDTKQIDFASDANPIKETSRSMMRMTQDINDKYLSLLGDRRYSSPITCGNCHLGQAHPPVFEGSAAR